MPNTTVHSLATDILLVSAKVARQKAAQLRKIRKIVMEDQLRLLQQRHSQLKGNHR